MQAQNYAKAVYESVLRGADVKVAFSNLDTLLKKRGCTKMKPPILRTLLRMIEGKRMSQVPVVTVARKGDLQKMRAEITAALSVLKAEAEPMVEEDEQIIGGFRASYRGREVDGTYKKKLLTLYRNVSL